MRNFSPWRALAPVAIAAFSCAAAAQSQAPTPPSPQAGPAAPGAQPDLQLDNRLPGESSKGDRGDAVPRDPTTPDADNGNGLGSDNDPGSNAQVAPENPANPPAPVFPANPKRPADPGQPGNPVTPTGMRLG